MNTPNKLAGVTTAARAYLELYKLARRAAITAVSQQRSDPPNPLGAVSHTAPAEGQGAHPGGVIRGSSPCATTPPRRDVSLPDGLRELAVRARWEMLDPWGIPDGDGTAGNATAAYRAAAGPDIVIDLLDEHARYRDALTVIADNPCSTPAGPMSCAERFVRDGGEWCMSCLARAGLDAQVWG